MVQRHTTLHIRICSPESSLCWVVWHLTSTISAASASNPMSNKTSTRVFQVTGCLPLPQTHSLRTSTLIISVSPWYLCSISWILAPVESSRRRTPNWKYFVPISWGMLIRLSFPWNPTHSRSVGRSAWSSVVQTEKKIRQTAKQITVPPHKVRGLCAEKALEHVSTAICRNLC